MGTKFPFIKFFPGDWLKDPVSSCSLAAQGLWLRMMFLAHDSAHYGFLGSAGLPLPDEQIAKRCGCSLEEYLSLLAELESAGVPERTPKGVIYSRRMVKDYKLFTQAQKNGALGPKAWKKKGVNPPLNPPVNLPLTSDICHLTSQENGGAGGKGPSPPTPDASPSEEEVRAYIHGHPKISYANCSPKRIQALKDLVKAVGWDKAKAFVERAIPHANPPFDYAFGIYSRELREGKHADPPASSRPQNEDWD
jgi:hypothetical protein